VKSLVNYSVYIVFKFYTKDVPQQDGHGLTTCSWDHFESKSSNSHGSGLQRFVKKIRMNILEMALTIGVAISSHVNNASN
jgi:hypothetical protein